MSTLDFRGFAPGCGCNVTDFWGWDAQGTPLRRPDEDGGEVIGESGVQGGGVLNLISTNYPDHGHLQGKTHTVETAIEPGTSWLVVRNSGH
jgi:hypothetical protein